MRANLGVFSPYDPGQGHHLLVIGNDHHLRSQLTLNPVQGDHFLPDSSLTHLDSATFKAVKIEGMHGLAVFHHHQVGYINHVVDRPQTHRRQTPAQPAGRWGNPHPAEQTGCITVALRRCHRYRKGPISNGCLQQKGGNLHRFGQRQTTKTGNFPGQTDNPGTVRAIGGQVNFDHRVLQIQGLAQRHPRSQPWKLNGVKIHNLATCRLTIGQTQFLLRAEHPGGELSANLISAYFKIAGQNRARDR